LLNGNEDEIVRDTPVIIFGAGATKDCGGPLTNEILHEAFQASPNQPLQLDAIQLLQRFLDDNFPLARAGVQDYPSLPLLLSLIDTAIDRKQAFGVAWPIEEVAKVREAVEAAIFAVLDFRRPQEETASYLRLLELAYPTAMPEATIISLNYDMIVDMAMFDLCDKRKPGSMPSYGCDVQTAAYRNCKDRWGSLFKIHGSVNWMYCSRCHHLKMGWSSQRSVPSRIASYFYSAPSSESLDDQYAQRALCPDCHTKLRPILITPTHRKDYRNPHLARIWYEAERALQRASRVIFVGYSLPDDDVEVIYLLKRGLGAMNPTALSPDKITVVETNFHAPAIHPVSQRYRALFGNGIDFRTEGFGGWLLTSPVV
jgi:SIR2-like domain